MIPDRIQAFGELPSGLYITFSVPCIAIQPGETFKTISFSTDKSLRARIEYLLLV